MPKLLIGGLGDVQTLNDLKFNHEMGGNWILINNFAMLIFYYRFERLREATVLALTFDH